MNHTSTKPNSLMQQNSDAVATFGLVIGCVLFGMGSLIVANLAIGGYALAFWRLFVAGVIFFILIKLKKNAFPTSRKAITFGLLSGVFLGVDLALWHESIYAVGPGISTLLNSLQLFFLAAIGYVFFKEKQTLLQLFSLLMAIVGIAMIAGQEFAQNTYASWGFLTGIISGGMLATSMTFIRKTNDTEPTAILPLMALVSIGGCLAMLPLMLLFDAGNILPTSMESMFWIFIYGAVMQCMAWGLIAYSIPRLSLALTGLLLLSEPVVALVIDYLWLDKSINSLQWTGALLTLLAIYLGSLKPKSHG